MNRLSMLKKCPLAGSFSSKFAVLFRNRQRLCSRSLSLWRPPMLVQHLVRFWRRSFFSAALTRKQTKKRLLYGGNRKKRPVKSSTRVVSETFAAGKFRIFFFLLTFCRVLAIRSAVTKRASKTLNFAREGKLVRKNFHLCNVSSARLNHPRTWVAPTNIGSGAKIRQIARLHRLVIAENEGLNKKCKTGENESITQLFCQSEE